MSEPRRKKKIQDGKTNLKNYEVSIRRRVDCEEKAFSIVNKLIDGAVKEEYLRQCVSISKCQ